MIPTVTVSADRNPYYRTNPGNATQDKAFLLNITEANKYSSADSASLPIMQLPTERIAIAPAGGGCGRPVVLRVRLPVFVMTAALGSTASVFQIVIMPSAPLYGLI